METATIPLSAEVIPVYEQLRNSSLLGGSRCPGYTLLLTRGMAAWLRAAGSVLPPVLSESDQGMSINSEMPLPTRDEIVKILANMVFTKQQEVLHGVC